MSCAPHSASERAAPPAKAPPVAALQPEIAECPPTGFPGPYRGIAISVASASDGDERTAGGGDDGVAPSHCGLSETFAARFWSRVDRSGGVAACWPWVASRGGPGYGYAWVEIAGRRVCVDAHRPAFVGKLSVSRSTVRGVLPGKSWRVVTGIRPRPFPQSIGEQLALSLWDASR